MSKWKSWYKRGISLLLAGSMILGMQSFALASENDDTKAEGDQVVISEDDKPYLALGADLSSDQKKTVLDLMGIELSELDQYDVVYVNNQEEHEYLDSYIASSEIGTRSLSSVVIIETEEGSGLNVSTHNINYCTSGIYKNAMATAGISDAGVSVA